MKTKNKIHHRWSNNPDTAHCLCTVCGIKRIKKTINNKTHTFYHLTDGSVTEYIPECIDLSLSEFY